MEIASRSSRTYTVLNKETSPFLSCCLAIPLLVYLPYLLCLDDLATLANVIRINQNCSLACFILLSLDLLFLKISLKVPKLKKQAPKEVKRWLDSERNDFATLEGQRQKPKHKKNE
jgi:hypothetical protein